MDLRRYAKNDINFHRKKKKDWPENPGRLWEGGICLLRVIVCVGSVTTCDFLLGLSPHGPTAPPVFSLL